jgi:hypothetical protein
MRFARTWIALALAGLALATPATAQTFDDEADAIRRWMHELRRNMIESQERARLFAARFLAEQREAIERAQRQLGSRAASVPREYERWPEVTEVVSRTLRLGRSGTFELQNILGDVVITGGRGDDVRIEATKRARHRVSSAARGLLREMRVETVERGGNVELRTAVPRRRGVWTAVDYVIDLPSRANVIIGIGAGDLRVRNVDGELRADAGDGNLSATDVRRVRHLRTMRGDIEVTDADADELNATTVLGDVVLRNVRGRVLDLNSVNGTVRLVDVETNRARLQTMAGDIEYAGPLSRSGRYEFVTHSGNIRVTPSGGAGFDLEAYSYAGDVRSDYALKRSEARRPAPRSSERTIRGTYGDAAAALTVRSFSGDILLVRR